jgi:NAD(P)-dependent dehydrogenase (short-subunit alcohol dehydrogenase family)
MRLRGKSALVTGAAQGIGLTVTELFTAEGAAVLGVDISEQLAGGPCDGVVRADVSDPAAMAHAVERAAARTGRLDICVANAGISLRETLLDGTPESWNSVLNVNLIGVMTTFRAAADRMAADGHGGRLLATSSTAGLRGERASCAYSASKGAVNALVQALACELAEFDITVNAVAPGEIDTGMHRTGVEQIAAREDRAPEAVLADLLKNGIPARRLGTATEVASVFAFLASDVASYITGAVLRVDGGQLLI